MNRFIFITGLIGALFVLLATPWAYAEVTLDLTLELPADVEAIAWDDLQLSHQNLSRMIFSATTSADTPYTDVFFEFALVSTQGDVFRGNTKTFLLPAGIARFTNLDLSLPQSPFALHRFEFTSDALLIKQKMMKKGYLPPGEYVLTLALLQSGTVDSVLARDQVTIQLKNPFPIELTKPRGSFASPGQVTRADLMFQWSSAATTFQLTIWKKMSSLEEVRSVVEMKPLYQTELKHPLHKKSFTPSESERLLFAAGCEYCWRVTALVKTSRGIEKINSPLSAFVILPDRAESAAMLAAVEKILGARNATVLSQFDDYHPTGKVRLDGKFISLDEFLRLADAFQESGYQMLGVKTQ